MGCCCVDMFGEGGPRLTFYMIDEWGSLSECHPVAHIRSGVPAINTLHGQ